MLFQENNIVKFSAWYEFVPGYYLIPLDYTPDLKRGTDSRYIKVEM